MSVRGPWVAAMLLVLVGPAVAFAQEPVRSGERIRVRTTEGDRHTGRLVEITPSDLEIGEDDGQVRVELNRVRSVDRSMGERRRVLRNLLVTMGVGAVALGAVAAAEEDGVCTDGPFGCLDRGGAFVIGFVAGAVYSLPVGVIIGLALKTERWEPATLGLPSGASSLPAPAGATRVELRASIPVGPR